MIDVAFTRAEVRPAAVAVVIDVLRASSSIVQALASGYARVLCAESLERARELRAPGRVLAGEQDLVPPEDFDLGNSPGGFHHPRGEELILATTNGAPALVAAAGVAERVLVGALLNLDAVTAALAAEDDVQLVCAGTHGRVGLEDVYVAGRIALGLPGPRTDATRTAECVAARYREPITALSDSEDARALAEVGLQDDVDACAQESVIDAVPAATISAPGVALVTPEAEVELYTKAKKSRLQPVTTED
ncbi:MAG: 2-phosphosulfolactate phosphatase [Solirubrobacteraceae bacterium MAG38_C4-C5]|nr:2-phosphosulfolactate phosphatase [Candidatus Siliceabacter maunaloa]